MLQEEGNGPLQTRLGPPVQSPGAQAAESSAVLVTVMPPPQAWPPAAGAALLAMWAPPLASCVTVGREQNLSVPPLLCLRRESVATFLRHPEE